MHVESPRDANKSSAPEPADNRCGGASGPAIYAQAVSETSPDRQEGLRTMRCRIAVVIVAAASLDLLSKAAASAWLSQRGVDLPGPLDLQLAHNPGVAFGVGRAAPPWLMLALTSTVVVVLAIAAWRGRFAGRVGVGLVLGGAIANVVDRIEAGTVVDMLDLGWWPTFNLADVWIVVGAGLLVLSEARHGSPDDDRDRRRPTRGARSVQS